MYMSVDRFGYTYYNTCSEAFADVATMVLPAAVVFYAYRSGMWIYWEINYGIQV